MVESLLIFSLTFESFKWIGAGVLFFAGGSSYFLKLASLWLAMVMVTWWRKRQIIWGYVLPMVHTHLVVIVMLRQKGKRSKVTFDKGCTGGCSPSWGGCRAGHEQPGQGNPLPPSYILIRTTNQCGNKNLTLRLIYILLYIQITSQCGNRNWTNVNKLKKKYWFLFLFLFEVERYWDLYTFKQFGLIRLEWIYFIGRNGFILDIWWIDLQVHCVFV